MGALTTQHAQPRARPAPLAPLRGQAHTRLAQIHQRVRGHLGRILDVFCRQIGAKLTVPSVQGVTRQQVEWHALSLDPFDHLQAQGDFRLERPLRRDAQLVAGLSESLPKPFFRQEQFTIHHRPQPAVGIGQAGVDPADIDLAQPAIVLS